MSKADQPPPLQTYNLGAFYGPNAGYVLDLYERFQTDPEQVDPSARAFFAALDPTALNALTNGSNVKVSSVAAAASATSNGFDVAKVVGAVGLTIAIREYGHLAVHLDPLGSDPLGAPELLPGAHGLSEDDLAALPASIVEGAAAEGATNAAEAIGKLREIYTGAVGYDFDHVQIPAERLWLRTAVESCRFAQPLDAEVKRSILDRLTEVETFERFLHQTYLGQKRFSIEGNDILVPMLDQIIQGASAQGTREVVMGMAHRGRLNVLTHVLGKPYEAILTGFEGGKRKTETAATDVSDDSTGDVKYHLGAKLARDKATGQVYEVPIVLAPNPSHLEAVNPVVEGMTRASQDQRSEPGAPPRDSDASLAILLHGDAAFPGQGVVAETLNLSSLKGYTVGGTIHIIVNNQIGYTTDIEDSRSTLYASDLAKGFEIPIVHVSADNPEACFTASQLAVAYRHEFGKDFLIDVVGYRRWGHNEGDEPAFTQPRMYKVIAQHPTVRAQWAEQLADEDIVSQDESKAMEQRALDHLAAIRRSVTEGSVGPDEDVAPKSERQEVETAITERELRAYHEAIHALPDDFKASPKLKRQWDKRRAVLDADNGKIDWAHAESLAFAAIIAGGTPIRLSGQDAERGTFSQRHLVLHDAESGEAYAPLQDLPEAKASFAVYNSPLSEAAAVGFEYGYSVHAPDALVLWEAQFGDFANGAQVLIDQFIASARAKWRQLPALGLLLPHGYEGQGPEHSSARLERFLQLAAGDNIRVVNCTSAAQYFHLLRRQAARLESDPRPLVLMSPKRLLRHPRAGSSPAEFTSGTFRPVIDDATTADREKAVTRLVLCSGKVAIDLEESTEREVTEAVAIARVEQLAPFQHTAISAVIDRYPNLAEIVWLQEEPRNMGAWSFMEPRLRKLIENRLPVRYIGRPERASPAEGSADRHAEEQARILGDAFAEPPSKGANVSKQSANGHRGSNGRKAGAGTSRTTKKVTAKG